MSIRCHLKLSHLWVASLLGLHILALFVVWLTKLPQMAAILLSAAIILSFSYHFGTTSKRLRGAKPITFSLEKNQISFFDGNEINWQGVVLPQTLVTPYFVLLRAKSTQRIALHFELIFCDAMSADEFRQLRTILRLA